MAAADVLQRAELTRQHAELVEKWRTLSGGDLARLLDVIAFFKMMLLALDDFHRGRRK